MCGHSEGKMGLGWGSKSDVDHHRRFWWQDGSVSGLFGHIGGEMGLGWGSRGDVGH